MSSESDKDTQERLQRLEEQCAQIPKMSKSISRIEYELIGDGYDNRPTFKSRLEKVEEKQKVITRVSAGGAGIVTIAINWIKQMFMGG